MRLPAFIIMFLPKKMQDKQIKLHWDSFSDSDILTSYDDDTNWIKSLNTLYGDEHSPLRDKFKKHLDEKVIPQMNQRGLAR